MTEEPPVPGDNGVSVAARDTDPAAEPCGFATEKVPPSGAQTRENPSREDGSAGGGEIQAEKPVVAPKKPAWGISAPAASGSDVPATTRGAPSFAEIMNDQSRDRAAARLAYSGAGASAGEGVSLAEIQAEQERLFASLAPGGEPSAPGGSAAEPKPSGTTGGPEIPDADEEERRMIELAIQQSLAAEAAEPELIGDGPPAASGAARKPTPEEAEREMIEAALREADEMERVGALPPAADAKPAAAAKPSPEEAEREMIEAALREADERERADAKPVAAAKPSPEDAERAMIEATLREADAKERRDEEAESLRLVMQLQQEELTLARQRQRHQERTSLTTGNVRTMTRAELEAEAYGGASASMPPDLDAYEDDDGDADTGFRMNQQRQNSSSGWYRKDRNTIVGPNNEIRTKHDVRLQGQTNASFLDLDVVDDDTGLRTHVGNTAFNAFRKTVAGSYHSKGGHRGTSKGVATHGTGRAGTDSDATKGGALDQHVRLHISRAINAGIIERCNGVVKQGKEAVVYHAVGGLLNDKVQDASSDDDDHDAGSSDSDSDSDSESLVAGDQPEKIPVGGNDGHDVAVKVFKRIKEFKGRGEYVDGDPRYAGRPFRSFTDREQLEVWTEKEYRNLVRAYRARVPVPNPIHYKENVIFMRFLGEDGWPAPQIREVQIRKGSSKWAALYDQVMGSVRRLFRDARLIHGDLSEYNILIAPNSQVDHKSEHVSSKEDLQAVLIDFGQAVEVRHPNAEELLRRDLSRVREFFTKRGVTTAMSDEEAMEFVVADHRFSINMNDVRMDDRLVLELSSTEQVLQSGHGAETKVVDYVEKDKEVYVTWGSRDA